MIFGVNFDSVIRLLLPTFMRRELLLALITEFISPLKAIYAAFIGYRNNNLYTLGITPQVCYLEKFLNDRFDPTYRRILINDALQAENIYLYLSTEGLEHTVYLNPAQSVYKDGEIANDQVDFIVTVPVGVTDASRLSATLDVYKLPTKSYELIYI